MFAYLSAEIKTAIFQQFRNANVTNNDRRQIASKSRQKLRVSTA